ncbi:hypothetical protein Tdes44962_MAKER05230 [Teratosphaeria destructans]|uniref:Uncharacterized protein n=1 Tax=Teratosphaeria destructans TaxID=418781 RepID=A0A9W7SKC5_9PEZI|nr:hypothetical protein Tdes44962_MAKER05230 [Teratosphaeria destructans]
MADDQPRHSFLDSRFEVFLPQLTELRLPKDHFDVYVKGLMLPVAPSTLTVRLYTPSRSTERLSKDLPKRDMSGPAQTDGAPTSRFMDDLLSDRATIPSLDQHDGKMLNENGDLTFRASGAALVDLFYELEDAISADRLIRWTRRGMSTKKRLSGSSGMLDRFILGREIDLHSTVQKKPPKSKVDMQTNSNSNTHDQQDDDFEILDISELEGPPPAKKVKLEEGLSEFDVMYGVAHGYWKDLLNILALVANGELKPDGNPRAILNGERPPKHARDWTKGRQKSTHDGRHERVRLLFQHDRFYRALQLSVARLFADQLKLDEARLVSGDRGEMKLITLAGKWAPTSRGMNDTHTIVVSTIAELLFPFDEVCPTVDPADRELYLKHARIAYQNPILSPLRKHIDVVERHIAANKFEEIKYDRVPSLAMRQYTSLFAKKDPERIDEYLDNVAAGKARVSGATLLPSTLVREVSMIPFLRHTLQRGMKDIQVKAGVANGQWETLVQGVKESGTLESSIAVCDVSGSMSYPRFNDGTFPMDSSIGLSLLLAEITTPPFGGTLISFSASPQVMRVGGPADKRTFDEKVKYIKDSDRGMDTNFEAVFTRLILPMAVQHKLKPEEMVKKVFVFSDMQFDAAGGENEGEADWRTSYQRIQKAYSNANYPVPELVFWNLAGVHGDVASKPVQADREGTVLVSGYSQGQMKMFLDEGQFEDAEAEIVTVEGVDGVRWQR